MQVLKQRAQFDCGIAALAWFAELSYEDAYVAFAKFDRHARGKSGNWNKEIVRAAASLGLQLVPTRTYDLDADDGVLRIRFQNRPKTHGGHFVGVRNGLIYDPDDGLSRAWQDYLRQFKARPCTLLKGVT